MKRTMTLLMLFATCVASGNNVAAEQLPAWLLRVPESVSTVFVGETATATFHRFDQVDGKLMPVATHYMSIGQNGPGKQRSGDRRTPIGAYFVTEQIDTERLHEKYGITAFVLDYPNAWDRRLERSGDGIWVHGVDPRGGRRPVLDTDGCIALPNEDLAALTAFFVHGETPVLIGESIRWSDAASRQALASELTAAVESWAAGLASGDLYSYLNAYADTFRRWGMSRDEWLTLRLNSLPAREISAVTVDDLLLLGYPGEDGLFLSRFRQTVTEAGDRRSTFKRLFWRRDDDGALRIVAEDNG